MVRLILDRLRNEGDITDDVSPNFLVRNWPPAFREWSTKSVQNVFYASPLFPRLTNPERVKDAIVHGVTNGVLAYVGKSGSRYDPFLYKTSISPLEIEISEDTFIIPASVAEEYLIKTREPPRLDSMEIIPHQSEINPRESCSFAVKYYDQYHQPIDCKEVSWEADSGEIDAKGNFIAGENIGPCQITARSSSICAITALTVRRIYSLEPQDETGSKEAVGAYALTEWYGEITREKWMSFYSKVLKDIGNEKGIKINVHFAITNKKVIPSDKIKEIESAMRELGLTKK